jgi:hypothetical protein
LRATALGIVGERDHKRPPSSSRRARTRVSSSRRRGSGWPSRDRSSFQCRRGSANAPTATIAIGTTASSERRRRSHGIQPSRRRASPAETGRTPRMRGTRSGIRNSVAKSAPATPMPENTPSSRKPRNDVIASPAKLAMVVSAAIDSDPESRRASCQGPSERADRLRRISKCVG